MSLKEKIENNLTLYTLSIVISAFVAGIGAYQFFLEMGQMKVLPQSEFNRLQSSETRLLDKEKEYNACLKQIEYTTSSGVDTQSKDSSSSNIIGDRNRPFFESNMLRIEVVLFEQAGPYYHLLMKHTNKADQPLSIRAFEHRNNTFLQDDNDKQYNYVTTYEAGRNNEFELSDRGRTIELPPRGSKVLSFNFARSTGVKGRMYSFSSKYGYCISESHCLPNNPLFVSVKGIEFE